MKSFKAKMYVEDGMATIEFDIELTGQEDKQVAPVWAFAYPDDPSSIYIYDASSEDKKIVGTMLSEINNETTEAIRKETAKFLILYMEGKICEKHNYKIGEKEIKGIHIKIKDTWQMFLPKFHNYPLNLSEIKSFLKIRNEIQNDVIQWEESEFTYEESLEDAKGILDKMNILPSSDNKKNINDALEHGEIDPKEVLEMIKKLLKRKGGDGPDFKWKSGEGDAK